jgi:hypothetical protein
MKDRNQLLKVWCNPDGSYTFKWDPNDPEASFFNDWTKEDFVNAILAIVRDKRENER